MASGSGNCTTCVSSCSGYGPDYRLVIDCQGDYVYSDMNNSAVVDLVGLQRESYQLAAR